MNSDRELVKRCLAKDSKAQEILYRLFAPKMYGVCLRFARNTLEADDILQEGFIKVFSYLENYRHEGSLEGWIRRIMINTAINFYKSRYKELAETRIENAEISDSEVGDVLDKISTDELLNIIQKLPEGYRMVFNLYIIEGYSHQEIAKMLNISENTSKSQLSRARMSLQQKIVQRKSKN